MPDVVELGMKVSSDGVKTASDRLGGLKSNATLAELAVSKLIRTMGTVIGAYASWQLVTGTINKFVDSTIEAEKVQRQLETVLKSTNATAGLNIDQLNRMSKALQQVTTFGDEAIGSAQALLLTFTRVGGEVFPQAIEAAMNLSVAMGTDLNGAIIQVGKALNDPIAGLTALSRVGIQFSAEQKEMIKNFMDTGDVMSAQKVILEELETQFGNSARAARGTLGGALQALGEAFGDLFEVSGPKADELAKSVEDLIGAISDPEFIGAVQGLGISLFNAFNNALPAIVAIINKVSIFFQEMDARANDEQVKFWTRQGDSGSVDAAARDAADRMGRNKFMLGGEGSFGISMEDFFKPFQTPASDPLAGNGNTGRGGGLSETQIEANEKLAEQYDALISKSEQRIAQLQIEAETYGMNEAEAMLFKNTQELLLQAEEKGIPLTEERIAQLEALAEKTTEMQLKLEGLQLTMENETPWETMARQVENLNELLDRGAISAGTYGIEIGKAAETMVKTYAKGANDVIGNIEKLTDALGLEGKQAFEVQKALGIARAVVSGAESITHSFNAGAAIGGPPLGFAFAGIAAAATAAQVAALASTTYQSKSVPSAGTSGSAPAAAPTATPGRSVTINLTGNENTQVSQGSVKSLLEQVRDELLVNGQELVIRYVGD